METPQVPSKFESEIGPISIHGLPARPLLVETHGWLRHIREWPSHERLYSALSISFLSSFAPFLVLKSARSQLRPCKSWRGPPLGYYHHPVRCIDAQIPPGQHSSTRQAKTVNARLQLLAQKMPIACSLTRPLRVTDSQSGSSRMVLEPT